MNPHETVDQFASRLRVASCYCKFDKDNEVIRDQLIHKCTDKDLRRKWLKKSGDLTLDQALEIGRLYEMEKHKFYYNNGSDQKEPETSHAGDDVHKVFTIQCY